MPGKKNNIELEAVTLKGMIGEYERIEFIYFRTLGEPPSGDRDRVLEICRRRREVLRLKIINTYCRKRRHSESDPENNPVLIAVREWASENQVKLPASWRETRKKDKPERKSQRRVVFALIRNAFKDENIRPDYYEKKIKEFPYYSQYMNQFFDENPDKKYKSCKNLSWYKTKPGRPLKSKTK